MMKDTQCSHCRKWMARLTDGRGLHFCDDSCHEGYCLKRGLKVPEVIPFRRKRGEALSLLFYRKQELRRNLQESEARTLETWFQHVEIQPNIDSLWSWFAKRVKAITSGAGVFKESGGIDWSVAEANTSSKELLSALKDVYHKFWI